MPTAEILPDKKWSVSGYRRGTNFVQGYSNVGDFAGTFGVGIKNRAGNLRLVNRRHPDRSRPAAVVRRRTGLRRDHRSVSAGESALDRRPYRRLVPGREGQHPVGISPAGVAVAARAMVQLPTGDDDTLGSGTDWTFDLIASKETKRLSRSRGIWGGASIAVPK